MRLRRYPIVFAASGIVLALPASAAQGPPTVERALSAGARTVYLGSSVHGRPIQAVRVGDPAARRKALVVGVIHGDEDQGLRIVRALRRTRGITGVDLWLVPTVNPDGMAANHRDNAHGVDLNRNFPYRWRPSRRAGNRYWSGPHPLSEPEARAVRHLVLRLRPAVSIWYHQPWNAVLGGCHHVGAIRRRYARIAHMRNSCRGHDLVGTAIKWENHTFPHATAFVVELRDRPLSAAMVSRNARAVMALARGG